MGGWLQKEPRIGCTEFALSNQKASISLCLSITFNIPKSPPVQSMSGGVGVLLSFEVKRHPVDLGATDKGPECRNNVKLFCSRFQCPSAERGVKGSFAITGGFDSWRKQRKVASGCRGLFWSTIRVGHQPRKGSQGEPLEVGKNVLGVSVALAPSVCMPKSVTCQDGQYPSGTFFTFPKEI